VLDLRSARHPVLGSPVMVTLGQWSYGLFIWHLAALSVVFPLLGRPESVMGFLAVLALTLVFGLAMAAVSYALIEEPCRKALQRWEVRRSTPILPVTDPGGDTAPDRSRAA
jgi:peptidoglycan/LPS O-acetylase OafA/YrhL